MSKKKCSIEACRKLPCFKCSCNDGLLFCKDHISKHLLVKDEHSIKNYVTEVPNDLITFILNYHTECIKIVNENIKKLKDFTNQIINSISRRSTELLHSFNKEKEMIRLSLDSLIKDLIIEKDTFSAIEENKIIYSSEFTFEFENIESILDILFRTKTNNNFSSCQDDEYALVFSNPPNNKIELIDLITFKKKQINFDISDFSYSCSCCKIDKDNYFIYGGYSTPFINTCKIIDIKNQNIEILPSDKGLAIAGSCYFLGEVYIFGGCVDGTNPIIDCKKFNLEYKIWKPISSLPQPNYRTSTYLTNKIIFIAGYQSPSIFKYNPTENNFSESKHSISCNSYKYLIHNWLVCFGDSLYEFNDEENLIRRQPFTDNGQNLNSFTYFKKGQYIYFVYISPPKLYRINTISKQIEVINYN